MITQKQKDYLAAQKAVVKAAGKADVANKNYSLAIETLRKVEKKMSRKQLLEAIQLVKS